MPYSLLFKIRIRVSFVFLLAYWRIFDTFSWFVVFWFIKLILTVHDKFGLFGYILPHLVYNAFSVQNALFPINDLIEILDEWQKTSLIPRI